MHSNMPSNRKQKGLTLVTWLLLMGLIGFLVLIVLSMIPIYTQQYKIQGVLHSLSDEKDLYNMNREQLLTVIDRKLQINMVSGFKDEYFTIDLKDNGNKIMAIKYEDRRNIMGNVDVIVKFDDSITVMRNGSVLGL